MASPERTSRPFVSLALAGACVVGASSASAETVVLDCTDDTGETCDSHWVINGDTKMVTWRWCKDKDTTEPRNVEITADKVTFDEDFMHRHYEFNRHSGVLTITAGDGNERWDDGSSVCHAEK
jgi:hypothetical protein